jgi:hypothetical protein
MKYNPDSPLSKEEVSNLSMDDMLSYLDSKAEYLKKFSRPLDTYHTKKFLAATKCGEITKDELRRAKEIGKIGDDVKLDNILSTMEKLGGDPKLKDEGIRNIKTNRKQWFE